MSTLEEGAPAPAFSLQDQSGEQVALASFAGKKVLVYFYPRADTPGCTKQACGLRDVLPELDDVVVVGISPDQPPALAKFDTKYELGFPLLSDADHAVAEAYGVWGERSMYGRKFMGIIRSAFLVGEDGSLLRAWPKISPADTPTKLVKALAEVAS
jgi:peroxiredoxin Q/BCP